MTQNLISALAPLTWGPVNRVLSDSQCKTMIVGRVFLGDECCWACVTWSEGYIYVLNRRERGGEKHSETSYLSFQPYLGSLKEHGLISFLTMQHCSTCTCMLIAAVWNPSNHTTLKHLLCGFLLQLVKLVSVFFPLSFLWSASHPIFSHIFSLLTQPQGALCSLFWASLASVVESKTIWWCINDIFPFVTAPSVDVLELWWSIRLINKTGSVMSLCVVKKRVCKCKLIIIAPL